MLFNSLTFILIFLPISILFYYCLNNNLKNYLLLLISLLFYAWGEPKFIILLMISILINYFLSLIIYNSNKLSKISLILAIAINVIFLLSFKYLSLYVGFLNQFFPVQFNLSEITLPIGISFYTFQVISYLVDVYKKEVDVQKNFFLFATYIAFFPHLIAGPIVRYSDIKDQLTKRKYNINNFCNGVRLFIIGLAKKVIIANNVAIIVDGIYGEIGNIDIYAFIFMSISFYLQIYFDFSGYSDMAVGLGKMFGFELKDNFDYPYVSTSITEFWRRWHISLSSWFKDYIYIPLGGNRVSTLHWIINILIVWILTGIWHGSNMNFILWGLYFGIIIILEKKIFKKYLEKVPVFIRWLYTFIIINIGWLMFKIEDFGAIKIINRNLLESIRHYYYLLNYLPYVIIGFILMFPIFKGILGKNTLIKDIYFVFLFLLSICYIVNSSYNPFLYFRF